MATIRQYAPKNLSRVVDLFGGGCNVGVNLDCSEIVYNDCNTKVKEILEYFYQTDTQTIVEGIEENIRRFNLVPKDKSAYKGLVDHYNSFPASEPRPSLLYTLILFGFNNQLRFNSKHQWNLAVGTNGFNDKIRVKLIEFCDFIKTKHVEFSGDLFQDVESRILDTDFLYCDPPYLVTLGSYNDGKRGFNGWTSEEEKRLLGMLDRLHARGIKFMLCNVLEHKGKKNEILGDWCQNPDFNLVYYKARGRNEVMVRNYD
jgi:adenine-specific DNA-methyltransferase